MGVGEDDLGDREPGGSGGEDRRDRDRDRGDLLRRRW